ncbi:MAG: YlxR family protein [Chloroflexota bacterium]|nr:MAG: YlxR family protein [Chloroflexota bacterium]
MPKHIPQRTCIGCQRVQAKRELMRVVRTPEGQVVADPTGKKNGRGTYIHKTRECFQMVLDAPGKLQHALKLEKPIAPDDLKTLIELGKSFPAQNATETEMKGTHSEPRRAQHQAAHHSK